MHRPPGTLSSFILRSRISCLFPLLCNEDDRDGLKGLGMVVWLGVGRKEPGVWSNRTSAWEGLL